jgi:hypothetical protein
MSDTAVSWSPPAVATVAVLLLSGLLVAGLAGVGTAQSTETEPNDDRTAGTPLGVDPGETVRVDGVLNAFDEDWLTFDARAGERLVVEADGTLAAARLRGPNGTVLDVQNPTVSRLDATAPTTGTYAVRLRGLAFGRTDYSLSVSRQTGPAPGVEFLNCTAARVTGDFDRVALEWAYNTPSGAAEGATELSRSDLVQTPDGAIVRAPADGLNGTHLFEVQALDENGRTLASAFDTGNERCTRRLRPRVNASLSSVTPDTDGTYTVTFGYTNNQTVALAVPGAALRGQVSGVSGQVPPEQLLPGERTFSVEWAPQNPDDRLVWQVGFNGSWLGYDEPLLVRTEPASTYDSPNGSDQPSIEYLNCTAARITGDFERVGISAGFNVNDGVDEGSTVLRREDLATAADGSAIVRSIWSGINGSVLSEVVVYGENMTELARLGFDAQDADCTRQVRPEVNASLVSVTEVSPGTYNVTFGYTSNETANLTVFDGALRGSVGNAAAPERLRPGRNTFSVEWTPENDSERFVWQVGFNGSWLGYDQPVLVRTEPASQYRPDRNGGTESERTLRIEAPSDAEVFAYTIRVEGTAELGAAANPETEDSVTQNGDGTVTIRGTVGLGSGDSYEFSGDVVCGSLEGAGTVLVDGTERPLEPCASPGDDDGSDGGAEQRTLRIEAQPDAEVFSYTAVVEGGAELGGAANPETEDSVTDNSDGTVTIRGTVGLGSGDSYEFSGEIRCVSLDGPGATLVEGQRRQFAACSA